MDDRMEGRMDESMKGRMDGAMKGRMEGKVRSIPEVMFKNKIWHRNLP